jgi:hypothetical protein
MTTVTVTLDQSISIGKVKAGPKGDTGGQGPPGTGADAISANITRDSYVIFCYAEGTPVAGAFAGCNGLATVMQGGTDVTGSATLSSSGSGCTGSINTAPNTPINGQPAGYYQVNAMSADVGTLTLTFVYGGLTIHRSFTVSKAKAGYEIVATLPVTNLFSGRIVFLTTDGKLYRYFPATGWTAAVDAVDITGQITSTQITDLAISTPKLAADCVTAQKILAGEVKTNSLATNAVIADKILAGEITGAKLATSNIISLSAQIDDLMVGTIHIQNDAVTKPAWRANNTPGSVGGGFSTYDITGCYVTITTTGAPIEIHCVGKFTQNVGEHNLLSIWRDNTKLTERTMDSTAYSLSLMYIDQPAAGTYTYKLCTTTGGHGTGFDDTLIFTLEVKK